MAYPRIKDAVLLFRLWHDETLTVEDIAQRLGVSANTVWATARRFKMGRRDHVVREKRERKAIDEVDDLVTCEDLRLDAWTEERARPIRDGWSEDERYHRRVQKIQPICYGGVYS
jgi:transposase